MALVSRELRAYFRLLQKSYVSIPFSTLSFSPRCRQLRDAVAIPVANEDNQRHAVAQLVRTWAGLGGIGTAKLVEQPVRWR